MVRRTDIIYVSIDFTIIGDDGRKVGGSDGEVENSLWISQRGVEDKEKQQTGSDIVYLRDQCIMVIPLMYNISVWW